MQTLDYMDNLETEEVVHLQVSSTRIETKVEEVSGVPVVRVAGEVDAFTTPSLRATMDSVIDAGARDLVVDLSGVSYMDSSGFGTLLGITKRVRPIGGKVYLLGCSDTILRLLRITRLDTVFELCTSLDEAIMAIKG